MNKLRRVFALVLTALAASTAFSLNTAAAGLSADGEAGIDFEDGDTVIVLPPDPDLSDVKSADIYFGEQTLSTSEKKYNSTDTHDREDLKHAGFIVSAANADGWRVSVRVTDFEMDGAKTMNNFVLKLTPGELHTTPDNQGEAPSAAEVSLTANNEVGDTGVDIFVAKENIGLGKWGCNWEGELTVPGGSVTKAGNASATMLWTLMIGDVKD